MLYGRYRFHCRFDRDASLPAYKGSTFRGAFGTALKQVVCALKRRSCHECLLRSQCLYTRCLKLLLQYPPKEQAAWPRFPTPL